MKRLVSVVVLLITLSFSILANDNRIVICTTVGEDIEYTFELLRDDNSYLLNISKDLELKVSNGVGYSKVSLMWDRSFRSDNPLLLAKIDLGRSGMITIKTVESVTTMVSNNVDLYFPEGVVVYCSR